MLCRKECDASAERAGNATPLVTEQEQAEILKEIEALRWVDGVCFFLKGQARCFLLRSGRGSYK